MKRYGLVIGLALLVLAVIGVSTASASDGIPDNCENPDSPYASVNTFMRYDLDTNELWLADWSTGKDIRLIDSGFEHTVRTVNWSPNCRYIAIAEGIPYSRYTRSDGTDHVYWSIYSDTVIHIYDLETDQRMQSLATVRETWLNWSPDSQIAYSGLNLWRADTNELFDIVADYYDERVFIVPYLDLYHNWLWIRRTGHVDIYSINNGELVQILNTDESMTGDDNRYARQPDVILVFSPDQSHVVLYGNRFRDGIAPALTVFDLTTFEGMRINVGDEFVGYSVQLSPDNRYLATAGINTIRIWDLANLPAAFEDREPIYILPYDGDWTFIDGHTLEVVGPKTIQWNLHTGEPTVIE